jgi:oleate hydratase
LENQTHKEDSNPSISAQKAQDTLLNYKMAFAYPIFPVPETQPEAPKREPGITNAYLIGGGIASLAAAVHLIQDAHVPANQISIFESGPLPGGSMDGAGNSDKGYVLRGGRMLNFSYLCTYELLSRVPSLSNPSKTVKQEIDEFNAIPGNKTSAHARLVSKGNSGPQIVDVSHMGLNMKERAELLHVAAESEHQLGTKRIDECFTPAFFETNFWYMWATM